MTLYRVCQNKVLNRTRVLLSKAVIRTGPKTIQNQIFVLWSLSFTIACRLCLQLKALMGSGCWARV